MSEKKSLYESPGEKGNRVLEYIDQRDFEALYRLIRHTEKTLHGFMSQVRRQRAGAQDFGDKRISEEQINFNISSVEEESG